MPYKILMYLSNSGAVFPSRPSSFLGGALLFLGSIGGTIVVWLLCFVHSSKRAQMSHHILSFLGFQWFSSKFSKFSSKSSAAYKALVCNGVLKLLLCLRRKIASLNPKKLLKRLHLWLYTVNLRPFFFFLVTLFRVGIFYP